MISYINLPYYQNISFEVLAYSNFKLIQNHKFVCRKYQVYLSILETEIFIVEAIFYNIKIKYSAAELCLLHLKTSRNSKRMSKYLCLAPVYIDIQVQIVLRL